MWTQRFIITMGVFSIVTLPSCATKKYVTAQVTPVTQRVNKVETRNTEQDQQIDVLETESSRTRESVADLKANVNNLDSQLKTTTETAKNASSAAMQAQQQASDARTYATTRSDTIEHTIENLDKLKLAKTVNVLFETGRSELGTEGKAVLDDIAKEVTGIRKYVLEIQGFTDSTGRPTINIPLSQHRAEAVVRYLTVSHNLPLRNVHLIGVGSASPVADNTTRNGRKQNRRVEIRLFAHDPEATPTSASAAQFR